MSPFHGINPLLAQYEVRECPPGNAAFGAISRHSEAGNERGQVVLVWILSLEAPTPYTRASFLATLLKTNDATIHVVGVIRKFIFPPYVRKKTC